MSPKNKPIKIRLKAGDKPGEVLDWLKESKAKEICIILERDFTVVTESNFINRLQEVLKAKKSEVYFVTQKPYFQSVLSQHKFRVQGYEPENFTEIAVQTLGELHGKIAAEKNVFEKKSIEFKPKLQTAAAKPVLCGEIPMKTYLKLVVFRCSPKKKSRKLLPPLGDVTKLLMLRGR